MSGDTKNKQEDVTFIYIRVSTAGQVQNGIGLETQETKCREHAERQGRRVLQVFRDEGISGKDGIEHRPGLAALLRAVRQTPGAVVTVYSISRLARRQALLWHLLDERTGEGLAVSSATEPFDTSTPMGRAMLGMIAVWSQLEADMVSERTKDALAEARARGVRLGRPKMKDTAPEIVQKVKDLYATGNFSYASLADHLNANKIPTVTGRGKWWKLTVQTAVNQ